MGYRLSLESSLLRVDDIGGRGRLVGTMRRNLNTLWLVVALAAPAAADTFTCPQPVKQPPRQSMVQAWPLLEQVAPMTSWSCLDGVTVGILHDAFGSIGPINWNNGVAAIAPQGAGPYLFTSANNTPMLPYFRAPATEKHTN